MVTEADRMKAINNLGQAMRALRQQETAQDEIAVIKIADALHDLGVYRR